MAFVFYFANFERWSSSPPPSFPPIAAPPPLPLNSVHNVNLTNRPPQRHQHPNHLLGAPPAVSVTSTPSPVLQHSPFDLFGLPDVPQLLILRYLDVFSLRNMQFTCQRINRIISVNRDRFVWRRVKKLTITQQRVYDVFTPTYELVIMLKKIRRFSIRMKEFPSSIALFLWLANTFPNAYINYMELNEFFINDEKKLEKTEEITLKKKLKINTIELKETFLDSDSAFRLLAALRPRNLTIKLSNNAHESAHLLCTDVFFSFMSTLRSLDIHIDRDVNTPLSIEMPAHVLKIPAVLYTSDVFLMPLATVVNVIRDWYDGASEFGNWVISLRSDVCSDIQQLMDATKLPYKRFTDGDRYIAVITNPYVKSIRCYMKQDTLRSADFVNLVIY